MNFMKIHCLNETGDVNLVQNAKNAKFEKPIIDEKEDLLQAKHINYNDPSLCLFDVFLEMQR